MGLVATVKSLFEETYPLVDFVVDDLSLEELKKINDGSTIMSLAAIYTHVSLAEDGIVQDSAAGGTTLWERGGWAAKTGLTSERGFITEEQAQAMTAATWDLVKQYTAEVRAETLAYIDGLSEADLDREVQLYGNTRNVAYVLSNYAFFHILQHQGEMAALKGVMGKKGMPY
jgi:uncharacterized damage-inducible protein DinB